MSEDDRPHFRVPKERVREVPVSQQGRSKSYVREDYEEHGRFLLRRTASVKKALSQCKDSNLTDSLYVGIKTPEGRPLRKEAKNLQKVGINLLTVSSQAENKGTARISGNALVNLQNRLVKYAQEDDHPSRSYLSVIEDINVVPAEEKIEGDLNPPSKGGEFRSIIFLHRGLSNREREAIIENMRGYLTQRRGSLIDAYTFSTRDTTAVVSATMDVLMGLGRDFSTVRQIRPDRVFFITDSTPIQKIPSEVLVNAPSSTVTVAVIDSGIVPGCGLLAPAIAGETKLLPPGASTPQYGHGTFVASRIAYGDDIEKALQNQPLVPNCRLWDVPVFGRDSSGTDVFPDEHGLAKAIDKAVSSFPGHLKVANISLGTDTAIKDNEFSIVANMMDQLSRQKDILFVTTAGNIRDPRVCANYPNSVVHPSCRIDAPGESLLALTVGSVARFTDNDTLSQSGELSPFSRVGPGADKGVKPELVAHGGNCHKTGVATSRVAVIGIGDSGASVAWDFGTSFAAPLVSGSAAQLFEYYGFPSANLVKALLCHFTTDALSPNTLSERIMGVGFGIPELSTAIVAGKFSAAFIHEGIIRKNFHQLIPFVVPKAFNTGKQSSKLRIRGTLVFDPPVQLSNPLEYSCGKMSMSLVKQTATGLREVPLGSDLVWGREWSPIIKFDKIFSRGFAAGEWSAKIRLWTRGPVEDFEQRFALIIEVIDEKHGIDVWAEVANETRAQFLGGVAGVAA